MEDNQNLKLILKHITTLRSYGGSHSDFIRLRIIEELISQIKMNKISDNYDKKQI